MDAPPRGPRSHGEPSYGDQLAKAVLGWLAVNGKRGHSGEIRKACRGGTLPQKIDALRKWLEENYRDLRLHERLPDPSLVPEPPKKRGQSDEDAPAHIVYITRTSVPVRR